MSPRDDDRDEITYPHLLPPRKPCIETARVALLEAIARQQRASRADAEALVSVADAVRLRRDLAARDPEAFDGELVRGLTELGHLLAAVGQEAGAFEAWAESVEVSRRLAARNPRRGLPCLADSLKALGWQFVMQERHPEALAPLAEAIDLYGRLAQTNPLYRRLQAECLGVVAISCDESGQKPRALAARVKAVSLFRRCAKEQPGTLQVSDLATALEVLGRQMQALGRCARAQAAAAEAMRLRQRVVAMTPEHNGRLAEPQPARVPPRPAEALHDPATGQPASKATHEAMPKRRLEHLRLPRCGRMRRSEADALWFALADYRHLLTAAGQDAETDPLVGRANDALDRLARRHED